MSKIPYPKITLEPYNPKNVGVLNSLSPDVFPSDVKEKFRQHVIGCHEAHALKYPEEPREFFIVPFGEQKEALERFDLRPPAFAALWLPAIALKVNRIREQYSGEEKEIVIVAHDCHFSEFNGNMVLAVDISMGFPTFVLWENNISRFFHDPNCCILVELT